jgi:hypothetical protein
MADAYDAESMRKQIHDVTLAADRGDLASRFIRVYDLLNALDRQGRISAEQWAAHHEALYAAQLVGAANLYEAKTA